MSKQNFWKPYPAQVTTAFFMAIFVVMFLIYSIVDDSVFAGVMALLFGLLALLEVHQAYKHVRMRREQWEIWGNHDGDTRGL